MSPKRQYKVVWDSEALKDLDALCDYIQQDSPKASKKVRVTIVKLAGSLKSLPERFPIEPLMAGDGNYRFVVRWHYKVIYEVSVDEVIIVAIIHTSRNPDIIQYL